VSAKDRTSPTLDEICVSGYLNFNNYEESNKVLTISRIRALSVLLSMLDPETMQENKIGYESTKKYSEMLFYLADFEELRIVQSLKDFANCNHNALARSLWLNYGSEPKVLLLIVNIGFDYDVDDLELWTMVLARMYKFEMVFNILFQIL
jgi:hypothetical protein